MRRLNIPTDNKAEPLSSLVWASEYDVFDPAYIANPFPIWDELRQSCPIAHTEKYQGSWLPTTYDLVVEIARDTTTFSSREITVLPPPGPNEDGIGLLSAGVPPISSDPPEHTWARRLLLSWFSPAQVEHYEPLTRQLCRELIAKGQGAESFDAATDYAQQIPVRIIGAILGVDEAKSEMFTNWVRDILEFANDLERQKAAIVSLAHYFMEVMQERRGGEGTDLISWLMRQEVPGHEISDPHILGTIALTLIAGIDTTWSAIGSSLWHLATNPNDRDRLINEPELMPTAIEELLRAYSPVTMARIVTTDTEFAGCPMKEGDRVLMNFPAANRDPAQFPDPDKVILDREFNRHVAFGSGIHRCAGSNLARMEMRVAIEEWLAAFPNFSLDNSVPVTWAGGQVRGPRNVMVKLR